MKNILLVAAFISLTAYTAAAQNTFEITGTPIPAQLLKQSYGNVPKGISAFDLNICNISDAKQSLTSSKVYQALMQADGSIQPVGRTIMLASILRSQNHSVAGIVSLAMTSATNVLSILGTSSYRVPAGWGTAAMIASIAAPSLLNSLKPVLTTDQVEKFEDQVLEPALVMDSGSCVERTVFTVSVGTAASKAKSQGLNFRIR